MNKLHENLSIQFFEFWYQVGLKNMDMIMSNVEPFVMKFNEMLQRIGIVFFLENLDFFETF